MFTILDQSDKFQVVFEAHGSSYFYTIDRKPRVSSLRWYAAYKNLLSGFNVISSLITQSRQKFGKTHDANLKFLERN